MSCASPGQPRVQFRPGRPRMLRSGATWCVFVLTVAIALHVGPGDESGRVRIPFDPPGESGEGRMWIEAHVELGGYPILLVGDSLPVAAPWPADRLCYPAMDVPAIAEYVAAALTNRRYEQIIIWAGTAHFSRGQGLRRYAQGMTRLIRLAEAHASSVIVIGPMPHGPADVARFRDCVPNAADFQMVEDTRAATARAVGELRRRLPHVPVFDMGTVRAAANTPQAYAWFFADGIHLTDAGFALLRQMLAADNTPVYEPGIRVNVSYRATRFLRESRGKLRAAVRGTAGRITNLWGAPEPDAAPGG